MHAGLEVLGPHPTNSDIKAKGTIVIGTVKGDDYDIGKNFVTMMLEIEVIFRKAFPFHLGVLAS